MTPNSHLYFDHYQFKPIESEPLAIGGYSPLSMVYGLESVPVVLSEDERKYIIGVQANVWTEYITTFSQVEYMLLPRLAALCEVQWTQPAHKDYSDFLNRLPEMVDLYNRYGYNYGKNIQ